MRVSAPAPGGDNDSAIDCAAARGRESARPAFGHVLALTTPTVVFFAPSRRAPGPSRHFRYARVRGFTPRR